MTALTVEDSSNVWPGLPPALPDTKPNETRPPTPRAAINETAADTLPLFVNHPVYGAITAIAFPALDVICPCAPTYGSPL
jgi:hypothetical protein